MTVLAAAWGVAVRQLARRRSVILGYHGVDRVDPVDDPENHCIAPERFRQQVELLLEAGFRFVTVAELAERTRGGVPPAGLAAISFDDGMENNHRVALPILRELGVPATVYVVTGLVGQANPWMGEGAGARMMDAAELRALVGAGIELGAHTVTHPDLSVLGEEDCLREIAGSRAALVELTGTPVRTFAYPYCRYGGAALAAVARAGLEAAVTCEGRGDWSAYRLRRAVITARDGMPAFVAKLADVYQPAFDSAGGRALRGATRGLRRRAGARR